MRFWLTRQADGSFMLTQRPPVITRVGESNTFDAYIDPGDAAGLRKHFCRGQTIRFFGREVARLQPLDAIEVEMEGRVVGEVVRWTEPG